MTVARRAAARAARSWRWPTACLLAGACLLPSSAARGDGGTLRFTKRIQQLDVSVFTDPTPVYMGVVDVSVLLSPVSTDRPVPLPAIQVCAYPVGKPEKKHCADAVAATPLNKLTPVAQLELTEPGPWQIEVSVSNAQTGFVVDFELPVENGYAARESYGLWVGLPVVAVLVFLAHRRLTDRRRRPTRPAPDPPAAA
jgi:hypothetical protein